MDRIAISIGILGSILGFVLGTRLANNPNESTPLFTAAGGGALFYIVAYELIWVFAVAGTAVFLFFFFRDVWPVISESIVEFSRSAGFRYRRFASDGYDDPYEREDRLDEVDRIIEEIELSDELSPQERAMLLAEYRRQRDALL